MTVFRYVFKQILYATLLITSALLLMTWITQSLRLTEMVVNHSVSVSSLFRLVALLIPDLLTIVLPLSTFIAILYVYHRLGLDHELVVLRSTGWSEARLSLPAWAVSLGVVAVMCCLNFYILPVSFQKFSHLEHELRTRYSTSLLHSGEFLHIQGVTVFVREREGLSNLKHIFLYDHRNPNNPITISAESGQLLDTPTGLELALTKGVRQALDPQTRRPGTLKFSSYTHQIQSPTATTPQRRKKSTERFISELFFLDDEELTPQQRYRYHVEGWQRLINPFFVLSFTAVALQTYIRRPFSRRTNIKALLRACGGALILQVFCFSLIQQSGQQPWMLVLVALALATPILRCLWFDRTQRRLLQTIVHRHHLPRAALREERS